MDQPTHAGGIVHQIKNAAVLYLLIRPKKRPDEWVFPKGHIEPGELSQDAAVREVEEETGVVARVAERVGEIRFDTIKENVRCVFYRMEYLGDGTAQEERETAWVPFEKAVEMLTHDSNKNLLKSAEALRGKGSR